MAQSAVMSRVNGVMSMSAMAIVVEFFDAKEVVTITPPIVRRNKNNTEVVMGCATFNSHNGRKKIPEMKLKVSKEKK